MLLSFFVECKRLFVLMSSTMGGWVRSEMKMVDEGLDVTSQLRALYATEEGEVLP